MRRFVALAVLLLATIVVGTAVAATLSPGQRVCLATATTTLLPSSSTWRSRFVQNQGPNTILCTYGPQNDGGDGAVAGWALEIAADGAMNFGSGTSAIYCKATTADQTSPNCTAVQGVP